MYILNVLFKFDSNTNGLFSGDDPNPISGLDPDLRRSMDWLELQGAEPPNPNAPPFDPETRNWTRLGQTMALLIPTIPFPAGTPDPANVGIRVAPHTNGTIPGLGAQLQLAVTFGRPPRLFQKQASPFTHNGQPSPIGNVVPTFIFEPQTRNLGLGWFFHLGTIAIRPDPAPLANKKTHRYEFAIGVTVVDGAQTL